MVREGGVSQTQGKPEEERLLELNTIMSDLFTILNFQKFEIDPYVKNLEFTNTKYIQLKIKMQGFDLLGAFTQDQYLDSGAFEKFQAPVLLPTKFDPKEAEE